MRWINRVSQLFQPVIPVPKDSIPKKDVTSKSYQVHFFLYSMKSVNTTKFNK